MTLSSRVVSIALLIPILSACSTLSVNDKPNKHIASDPFEGINRSIYAFNTGADKLLMKPAAKTYNKLIPKPAKQGVSHFLANLGEPLNALNNLLQGKFERALISTYRFAVNSTIGVFGLFDVAKNYDVEPAKEDFGQTLAAWGVGPGPYLVLPFAGPTNLRDGFGRLADTEVLYPHERITNTDNQLTGLVLLDVLALRTTFLGTDDVLDSQLDPYGFLKRVFEQNRIETIYDGSPPQSVEEDYEF